MVILIQVAMKSCKKCVRNSEESHGYQPGEELFWQRAGIYHLSPEFDAYMEGFLETEEELAFGQVVGHSYDLDTEQMWEKMEGYLQRISSDAQVWPATHLEVIQYLQAMKQAVINGTGIQNHSDHTLWFEIDGKICRVDPGEVYGF